MLINILVGAQILTMLILGSLWATEDWRRATAQFLYAAATVVLFAKL